LGLDNETSIINQTSSIECYLHSQGPNKTSTLSTTQIVYSSTTMPHHLNDHTHTHDIIPQPCTTISLSPCINYVDGSPLGPVSLRLCPLSRRDALGDRCPAKRDENETYVFGKTGHVRNSPMLLWSLCHCWKEMSLWCAELKFSTCY
jgi:hypothetical protein